MSSTGELLSTEEEGELTVVALRTARGTESADVYIRSATTTSRKGGERRTTRRRCPLLRCLPYRALRNENRAFFMALRRDPSFGAGSASRVDMSRRLIISRKDGEMMCV